VETNEPIWPKTVARIKRALPAITYIHIDKPQQPARLEASRPLERRGRSTVNPSRANQRSSQGRQRRR
jgi:hypothetical protein